MNTPLYPDVAFCVVMSSCATRGRLAVIAIRMSTAELDRDNRRSEADIKESKKFGTLKSPLNFCRWISQDRRSVARTAGRTPALRVAINAIKERSKKCTRIRCCTDRMAVSLNVDCKNIWNESGKKRARQQQQAARRRARPL
jgi:hypothetical protein